MGDIAILFDKPFPEIQVKPPYESYYNAIIGNVFVTAGFMEPYGHGYKTRVRKAIYSDGIMKKIYPGRYNIGFDYSAGFGKPVICMYSGTVVQAGKEGGYGNRIHIKLNIPFIYKGKQYDCYQAYAHCSKLLKKVGQKVGQGDSIAIEAGHGEFSPYDYGSHVDLDTYCFIDGEKIHINFELLAKSIEKDDFIESLGVMRIGDAGLGVRWLQKQLEINSDGIFGKQTEEAVKKYQKSVKLSEDGIAGEKTCISLNMIDFAFFANQSTVIKYSSIQSSDISNPYRKFEFNPEDELEPLLVSWIKDEHDHWLFELKTPKNNRYSWYAFKPHVKIIKGYNKKDDVSGEESLSSPKPQPLRRWQSALSGCQTNGCSLRTARQEGLLFSGPFASQQIAKKSISNIDYQLIDTIKKVSHEFNIPFALTLGLASRESHMGQILGLFGTKKGWGDNNNAWGVLQVDKRFHNLRGLENPYSENHIRQAVTIFIEGLEQIQEKHPSWSDGNILKGACVAYNAGVSNVRTIRNMNKGTTNDDYGDDVIARSQYYADLFSSHTTPSM